MWMRCNFCLRTLLILDQPVPSPFFREKCRKAEPGFVARFADRMLVDAGRVVRPGSMAGVDGDGSSYLVIDVTPKEAPHA